MGIGVSSNTTSNYTNLTSEAFNSCPTVTASNIVSIDNVKFQPDKLCYAPGQPQPEATIDQNAGVNATCVITALQKSISQLVAEQTAAVQGGLGFQYSSNSSDIETQITQKLANSCGSQSSTNAASVSDTIITACQWHFVENATVQESCQINELQSIANSVSQKQDASTKGASVLGSLFGSTGGIIITVFIGIAIVVAVIVVIVVISKQAKAKKANANNPLGEPEFPEGNVSLPISPITAAEIAGGSNNFSCIKINKTYTITIIILLILLFVVLLIPPSFPKKIN